METQTENLHGDRFENWLKSILYRFDCPSVDILRDHYWGDLMNGDVLFIKQHLKLCPHCTDEINELKLFMDTTDAIVLME